MKKYIQAMIFLKKMLAEEKVRLSNAVRHILRSLENGFNILADKPMVIDSKGIVIMFAPTVNNTKAGFISIDEGRFEKEKWIPGRRMNGD